MLTTYDYILNETEKSRRDSGPYQNEIYVNWICDSATGG